MMNIKNIVCDNSILMKFKKDVLP